MGRARTISFRLFVMMASVILIVFILIYFSFNLFVNDYIKREANAQLTNAAAVVMNLKSKTVTDKKTGTELFLTPNEFNVLSYLIENKDKAVSREELLDKIWGFTAEIETRVADDTVKRLRKKLSGTDVVVDTVWGYGFRLKVND